MENQKEEAFKAQLKEIINLLNQINEHQKSMKTNSNDNSNKSNKIQTGCYFKRFPYQKHYMNNSTGERSFVDHIYFNEKYETIPHVMASLIGLDAGNSEAPSIRVEVNAENIDPSGFDIRIKTWLDSKIFNVKVSWISFG